MLVFIHISKTGGTTLRHILRSSYGLRHCTVQPWHHRLAEPPFSSKDLQRLRKLYPNLKSIAGHRVVGHVDLQEQGTEFQYVTLLRDPLKRHASYFQFKAQERGMKDGFEKWMAEREWPRNRQVKSIAGVADATDAIRMVQSKKIFVGLVDRFDESMLLLKTRVASDLNISYKRVNVAPRNTLAQEILSNERTRQMLIEANQADLAFYDYVKQELYPTYQKEYGPSLAAAVQHYQETQDRSFNQWNMTLGRLKHYLLYQPSLFLYRRLRKADAVTDRPGLQENE